MIYVGLDDTDMLDMPGTNQLARHLVGKLVPELRGSLILRHQLLEDPRVPCTRKNGCASLAFEPQRPIDIAVLAARLRELILAWCPQGSDPGLCIAERIPPEVALWGQRAKRELLTQSEARQLAATHGIHLEGLAGTQDGVIGALAAVGLMSTRNDGRVVYLASEYEDALDINGQLSVETILARGIDAVVDQATNEPVARGAIEVAKKIRPNLRFGRVVLFVARKDDLRWEAVKVT